MTSTFVKRINYWSRDFLLNHGSVGRNLKDIRTKLRNPSASSREELPQNSSDLQNMLSYAVHNTEYYANLGLGDNARLDDFPVMNKTLLNAHYEQIQVAAYKSQKIHKMHTSGSTGIPFTVVQNVEKRDRHIADLKYFGALCGYRDHDPMCYLRAKPTATLKEQKQQNIWQLDICNLTAENLTRYYHIMVDRKCTALIAYPSTLETAVSFWREHFRNESRIQTVISTSETLTDQTRKKLQEFFGPACRIVARYSNTENGILGQEETENNTYTLNWASYYFEIFKLESDEPAPSGELGRIIVTDLFNRAFPMIRYDTGDVGKIIHPQHGFPVLSELYGRRMDLIYDTQHRVVSPLLLCRTMRLSKGIEQWQFIQNSPTHYILKLAISNSVAPSCEKEIFSFRQVLGEEASIEVKYVNEIPVMNSLKRKLIVSNLNKAQTQEVR